MYSVKTSTSYEEWMTTDEAQALTTMSLEDLMILKEELIEQGYDIESISDLAEYDL